ncbi:MAG: peptide chain release factor 2 [Candidatus Azambacteria bacterium]|nr:peptide chain release factor 2 [Candidatus Azambacteria bacterium]
MINFKEKITNLTEGLQTMKDRLDLAALHRDIATLETLTQHEHFWDDHKKAAGITAELDAKKEEVKEWDSLNQRLEKATHDWEFVASITNQKEREQFEQELATELAEFERVFTRARRAKLFSSPYDKNNAILSVYAGAGGQDAQDWASMLLRMYIRYAEEQGWRVTIVHQHFGEGSGEEGLVTKNATMEISGKYVYGNLKKEMGVHRLVRVSPFSSQKLRHTSFAFVEVIPEVEEVDSIEIPKDDLVIDTFRSSGPGGQNVNKRETAIRIHHVPTGIIVACQSQRNQQANKEQAMRLLVSRLAGELEKQKAHEVSELKGERVNIEWGSQIRSYVLHPYQMVKDHRTGAETSRVKNVLEGDLGLFIEAELGLDDVKK